MMIMGNQRKIYIGAIEDEKEAAIMYDKVAILVQGLKAKTNFSYTKREVTNIIYEFST